MRRLLMLSVAAVAAIIIGSLLVGGSEAAPANQDAPERLVVFEFLGREA